MGKEEKKEDVAMVVESEEEPEVQDVEETDEAPPKVELTAEEKQTRFIKTAVPDLTSYDMSSFFATFTMPQKDEGFDDIKFTWEKSKESEAYLRNWIIEKKTSTKVENLKPSDWFKQQKSKWDASVVAWNKDISTYKAAITAKDLKKKNREKAKAQAAAKAAIAAKAAEAAAKA